MQDRLPTASALKRTTRRSVQRSCIIPCLHKISPNAHVEHGDSIEVHGPCPRLHGGDALVGSAWLPRSYRRRADLRVSSAGATASAARDRFISAEHLAGSIHGVFPFLCRVHRFTGFGKCRAAAHPAFYGLAFSRGVERRARGQRPRRRVAGGRRSVDRRRRLWRLRRVPDFRAVFDGTLTRRGFDHYRACLSPARPPGARLLARGRSALRASADCAARVAPFDLPIVTKSPGRPGCDRGTHRDPRSSLWLRPCYRRTFKD